MMLSIVMPLYNKEKLIQTTLESVLNQTYSDFELIIVNDGSTDNSAAIVSSFKDSRIHLVYQENAGVSAARNKGIEIAQGEYIALMDSDDLWLPDYLERQIALMIQYPNCDIYASNYSFFNTNGVITYPQINKCHIIGNDGIIENYFDICRCSNPLITSISVIISKEILMKIGGFPLGIKSGEDLLTWAKIVAVGKLAYSKEPLAIYRLGYSNPRPPESIDYVGEQLEVLYRNYPNKLGLKKYVAFWYKMRMCRCLAHKMWKRALMAFSKSLYYNVFQGKIYLSIVKYTLIGLK